MGLRKIHAAVELLPIWMIVDLAGLEIIGKLIALIPGLLFFEVPAASTAFFAPVLHGVVP